MTSSEPAINLEFLPDWAKESSSPRYSDMEVRERNDKPGFKPRNGHGHPRGERRDDGPRGGRFGDRGDRKSRDGKHGRRDRDGGRERHPREPVKTIEVETSFLPEANALTAVVQQLRSAPRAYPVFSLAKMFLEKPNRQDVQFRIKNSSSEDYLFKCEACQFLTPSETEAVSHVLKTHQADYYLEEKTQVEAPKGNFTSVAQCKLNGKLLGPSNHHEYQANLMHMYKAEFSRMPFDRFKESIVSIRDPEVVKKWQEQATTKSNFKLKEQPDSPALSALELERHFRANFYAKAISKGKEFIVSGEASRTVSNPQLNVSLRSSWEAENKFPQNLSRLLRERFTKEGLQIFKGKKGMQFVSIVRPKPLVANPADLSKNILDILEFIKNNPNCTKTTLIEGLKGKAELPAGDASALETFQKAVLQDLLWLTSQGHVIEYNNGLLELARPPKEKPESKQAGSTEAKSGEAPSENATAPTEPHGESSSATEVVPSQEDVAGSSSTSEPAQSA